MPQPDFGQFFHQSKPKRLRYEYRQDVNGLHDIIYLQSFIHDSTFSLGKISLKRRELVIPLERLCWEVSDTQSTFVTPSQLAMRPVLKYEFSCRDTLAPRVSPDLSLSIRDFHFAEEYWSTPHGALTIGGLFDEWSLKVYFADIYRIKIRLFDAQVPKLQAPVRTSGSSKKQQS